MAQAYQLLNLLTHCPAIENYNIRCRFFFRLLVTERRNDTSPHLPDITSLKVLISFNLWIIKMVLKIKSSYVPQNQACARLS